MGHMGQLKQEYRALMDRLDHHTVAMPRPEDQHALEGWRELLEIMYTPEEAALLSGFPRRMLDAPKTLDELAEECARWREQGLTVVVVNGAFDVLHVGHLRYLAAARDLGDRLVAAVNSDLIPRSPCRGIKLPKDVKEEMRFLSAEEVEQLADAQALRAGKGEVELASNLPFEQVQMLGAADAGHDHVQIVKFARVDLGQGAGEEIRLLLVVALEHHPIAGSDQQFQGLDDPLARQHHAVGEAAHLIDPSGFFSATTRPLRRWGYCCCHADSTGFRFVECTVGR